MTRQTVPRGRLIAVRGRCDGGCREGIAWAGWVVEAAFSCLSDGAPKWHTVLSVSIRVDEHNDSLGAEFCAFTQCLLACMEVLHCRFIQLKPNCRVECTSSEALQIQSFLISEGRERKRVAQAADKPDAKRIAARARV